MKYKLKPKELIYPSYGYKRTSGNNRYYFERYEYCTWINFNEDLKPQYPGTFYGMTFLDSNDEPVFLSESEYWSKKEHHNQNFNNKIDELL